ncbi:SPX domain-containing protein [Drosera capensis]
MKFGKSLSNQIEETIPEWRDKFLSYKDLKRKLKLIDRNNPSGEDDVQPASKRPRMVGVVTDEEIGFIKLLEGELEKFNGFFVEKEEEYIIRLKELQERVQYAKGSNELMLKIRKEIVDFHGEMVLLENYSALNYTGLVKILKKYDKRTGALIRLPFIQRVLHQPFFTMDLLYNLIKECETMLDLLFPKTEPSSTLRPPINGQDQGQCDNPSPSSNTNTSGDILLKTPKELAEIVFMESLYMKSTVSALRALKEIRSKSSTVSMFSLPPLQLPGLEETWKKIPVLEQAAK